MSWSFSPDLDLDDVERATLLWCTDIHLNFLKESHKQEFYESLVRFLEKSILSEKSTHSYLILSGDIGESDSVAGYLDEMSKLLKCKIFFVLGNHDYYGSDVKSVRAKFPYRDESSVRYLHTLPEKFVSLSETWALVGVDGWGDGRNGRPMTTHVCLNDFVKIKDLSCANNQTELVSNVRLLGNESAERLRDHLTAALENHKGVVVTTHVPPFKEASWHEGKMSDDNWLPWFTCKATGDVLREIMSAREDRICVVLCGHTHGTGRVEILPNLTVLTGGADYGIPEVQGLLCLSSG